MPINDNRVIPFENMALIAPLLAENERLKAETKAAYRASIGEVWYWQGDGEDHPETTICPILIEAEDFNAILSEKANLEKENERLNAICDENWGLAETRSLMNRAEKAEAQLASLQEKQLTEEEKQAILWAIWGTGDTPEKIFKLPPKELMQSILAKLKGKHE